MWVEWRDGGAYVEAVRTFSDADVAGVHPGMVITQADGAPVDRRHLDKLATARTLTVRDGSQTFALRVERTGVPMNPAASDALTVRRMGEERDIGYIRIRFGADDASLARHVEGAVNYVNETRALILDLRDQLAPGAPGLAASIAAKLAAYREPLVLLTDRWTAGEAETLARDVKAKAGTRSIGTRTSGVVAPPLVPDIAVDLAAPQGGPGDPILYQALKLLEPCPGPACRSAPGSPPPARGSPRR